MAGANDELLDALIRRQIDILRFSTGLEGRVIRAIDSSERAIVSLLRDKLVELGAGSTEPTKLQLRRLSSLLNEVKELRGEAMGEARLLSRSELGDMVFDEALFVEAALTDAIGVQHFSASAPTRARLRGATFGTPFGGRKYATWFKGLEVGDTRRLEDAIRAGFMEGDGVDQIVRRVRGTPSLSGTDGATQVTRNSTKTLVRTTTNAFSNAAREQVFAENSEVIDALLWTSVLDGRTSPICKARDGKIAPTVSGGTIPDRLSDMPRLDPPGARPPAHPNCRSVMTAIVNGAGIVGNRPTITDTRTRRAREVDFRKISRDTGKPIQQVRRDWAAERVGSLPGKVPYQKFLGRQSAAVQDDFLGPTRGALFRRGDLTLDSFVDRTGRSYTIPELRNRNPAAFLKANLTSKT